MHHDKGKEQGERNGRSDDKPAAPIAEEEDQDEDHDERSFEQVIADGGCSICNQLAAIEKGLDADAFRQRFLDFCYALFNGFNDFIGVGVFEHHDDTAYGFALSVFGHGAIADGLSIAHLCHVFDHDGQSIDIGYHDMAQIV